jgi:hypothetical protein
VCLWCREVLVRTGPEHATHRRSERIGFGPALGPAPTTLIQLLLPSVGGTRAAALDSVYTRCARPARVLVLLVHVCAAAEGWLGGGGGVHRRAASISCLALACARNSSPQECYLGPEMFSIWIYSSKYLLALKNSSWGSESRARGGRGGGLPQLALVPATADEAHVLQQLGLSEKGVRLAHKMQVGPCIPVEIQLFRAEVGLASGPTRRPFLALPSPALSLSLSDPRHDGAGGTPQGAGENFDRNQPVPPKVPSCPHNESRSGQKQVHNHLHCYTPEACQMGCARREGARGHLQPSHCRTARGHPARRQCFGHDRAGQRTPVGRGLLRLG